jgi:hypothetical protein
MKTYEIKIEGATDALQNRLSKELADDLKQAPRGKKDEWEEANWKKKRYTKDIEGKEYIVWPELNLHSMLVDACKRYRIAPPTALGKTWTNYVKAGVLIPEHAVIEGTITSFSSMVNGNPSAAKKSSKVYRVRPKISSGWTASFKIIDTEEYLDMGILKGILEIGGLYVGIGDWRPQFGRFYVKQVKAVQNG